MRAPAIGAAVVALAAAFAVAGGAAPPPPAASVAGVKVGDTQKRVIQVLGRNYMPCPPGFCRLRTWLYIYARAGRGEPLGVGVVFRDGRVAKVFRLGRP